MKHQHITILGGGPAGLAVGYYARKYDIPFTIYEAADHIGGNCITFRHGEFSFDSGAHRFHDKIPEVTNEIQHLFNNDFARIEAPSAIYFKGKFIDFPLSPLDLLKKLGPSAACKASIELLAGRLSLKGEHGNFRHFAIHTYGKIIAESFLLGYSEKLWGLPSDRLSPKIAGSRMKGLDLKVFIMEALLGRKAKTAHLDGAFYYPSNGIGTISEKLGEFCGEKNIRTNSRLTGIIHDGRRISAVAVNGGKKDLVDFVVSTLPLDHFLSMMNPPPGRGVGQFVNDLKYRSIIIVALFLNKNSVSENASIYFPDSDIPFTRIHEPKNRSCRMSPEGKTSLIVEIPCQKDDVVWKASDEKLIQRVSSKLIQAGLIAKDEIIGSLVKKMPYAYPVLEVGFEEKLEDVNRFLNSFSNLAILGRNGKFVYGHIHDMMNMGRAVIERYRE